MSCWQPRELWFGSTGVPTDPLPATPHACHALWLGELHAGHAWPPFLHVLQPFHTAPLHVTLPLLLDGQCHFLYLFTCVVSLWLWCFPVACQLLAAETVVVWGYPTDQLFIWRSMQVVTQCDLPAVVTVGVSPMHLHRFQQLLSGVGPHGRLIHCSGQPGIAGHGWLRWHRVARPWGSGWPEQHWRWAP